MRCAEAISAIAHTGHSEEIHSPDECASTVVRRRSPASLSIVVVWIVAISYRPRPLRTMSRPLDNGAYWKLRSPSRWKGDRIVATSDFSGLVSSACALESAAAMVPMDSLERCMAALHAQDIKAHRTGFGSFGSNTVADRFLGVLGHKGLELRLGILMLEVSFARALKYTSEFRPGVGCAHVDDAHRCNPRAGRLEAKQARRLAILNAAPELFLGREQEVLVEGIG